MKKFILLAAASLTMAGSAIAHEGKDCCKGKDKKECSKEVAAKKEACKEGATASKSSCCQKGGEASAKNAGGCAGEAAAHAHAANDTKTETAQK